jgi:RNA polymerase sigma-B factor
VDDPVELEVLIEEYTRTRDPRLHAEVLDRANWLAVRGARRFSDRGEPFDDLLQVARLGLIKALDRFDPTMGVPFSAYATPTILGELRRYFRDHTWSVHVSRRAKDLRPMVNAMTEKLSGELGRSPKAHEVAEALDLSVDAVLEALEANHAYRAQSLDPAIGRHSTPVDAAYDDILDRNLVERLLATLPERERTIIELRFFEGMTQSQIADRVGTSQVHVGRLIVSTLSALKTQLSAQGL